MNKLLTHTHTMTESQDHEAKNTFPTEHTW